MTCQPRAVYDSCECNKAPFRRGNGWGQRVTLWPHLLLGVVLRVVLVTEGGGFRSPEILVGILGLQHAVGVVRPVLFTLRLTLAVVADGDLLADLGAHVAEPVQQGGVEGVNG